MLQPSPAYNTKTAPIYTMTNINPFNSQSTGQGRGRGHDGRNNSGGRGRGSSRSQQKNRNSYHPYGNHSQSSSTFINGNLVSEAKMVPPKIFNNLTPAQKKSIADLKAAQGVGAMLQLYHRDLPLTQPHVQWFHPLHSFMLFRLLPPSVVNILPPPIYSVAEEDMSQSHAKC